MSNSLHSLHNDPPHHTAASDTGKRKRSDLDDSLVDPLVDPLFDPLLVDPLVASLAVPLTNPSLANPSINPINPATTFASSHDCKPMCDEAKQLLDLIQKDIATNWLLSLSTCGGQSKKQKGHATKIKMQGTKFSFDGQRILKAGGTPTKEHRVRTQTIGLLINKYDPTNRTGLQKSAFSKLTNSKYIRLFKQFMALHRPGFKFTSIQVNVNTTSAPHVDGGNSGPSIIVGAGNYTGGRTVLWPSFDRKDSTLKGHSKNWQKENMPKPPVAVDISTQTLRFDGDKTWHASETFTGMRWSFVFFTMKPTPRRNKPRKAKIRRK
jgi:hypothetical protein